VSTKRPWPLTAAKALNQAESVVLILIGAVLVILAVLLLWTSASSMIDALRENKIGHEAIEILNSVLLVMMTMEIVYTVAISLQSHTLVAEPFLIIGDVSQHARRARPARRDGDRTRGRDLGVAPQYEAQARAAVDRDRRRRRPFPLGNIRARARSHTWHAGSWSRD
jgi:hypothetical protein